MNILKNMTKLLKKKEKKMTMMVKVNYFILMKNQQPCYWNLMNPKVFYIFFEIFFSFLL